MSEIFEEGYQEALGEMRYRKNPYPEGSEEAAEWMNGYNHGVGVLGASYDEYCAE